MSAPADNVMDMCDIDSADSQPEGMEICDPNEVITTEEVQTSNVGIGFQMAPKVPFVSVFASSSAGTKKVPCKEVKMWVRDSTPQAVNLCINTLCANTDAKRPHPKRYVIADLLNLVGRLERRDKCRWFDADPNILYRKIIRYYLKMRSGNVCIGVLRCITLDEYVQVLPVFKRITRDFPWMKFIVLYNDGTHMPFHKERADKSRNLYCYQDLDDRFCLHLSARLNAPIETDDKYREYRGPKTKYNARYDCLYDTQISCVSNNRINDIEELSC